MVDPAFGQEERRHWTTRLAGGAYFQPRYLSHLHWPMVWNGRAACPVLRASRVVIGEAHYRCIGALPIAAPALFALLPSGLAVTKLT